MAYLGRVDCYSATLLSNQTTRRTNVSKEQATMYADERKSISQRLLGLREESANLHREVKKLELQHTVAIANETDDFGKPMYSNAEKRQAELNNRVDMDPAIKTMNDRIAVLDHEIAVGEIDRQYAIDMLGIHTAFAGEG